MELVNRTDWAAERLLSVDHTGAEVLAVIVKATWALPKAKGDALRLADEQAPVVLADTFLDEPGVSSLVDASDLHPEKPGCDLVLRGTVRPGRKVLASNVTFGVGRHKRAARVFGRRLWYRKFGITRMSDPEAFEELPLIWENAYGGRDRSHKDEKRHDYEARNPVGRGYRAKKSKLDMNETLLPAIENPAELIKSPKDHPEPAGFGFVGRDWQPRAKYAGTYDDAWRQKRMPLLPEDFDLRYFDRGAPGLVAKEAPAAGTPVKVHGMTAGRDLEFALPSLCPTTEVLLAERREQIDFRLHTVLVDTDRGEVQMTAGAWLRVHGEVDRVAAIIVRDGEET